MILEGWEPKEEGVSKIVYLLGTVFCHIHAYLSKKCVLEYSCIHTQKKIYMKRKFDQINTAKW